MTPRGLVSISMAERPAASPLAGRSAALPDAREDFAAILGIEERAPGRAKSAEQTARATAEAFVAKVFIEPVLAEARAANTQPPPFGPGQGEKQFAGLMDAQRAIDMVRGTRWPIVDRLTDDLLRRSGGGEGLAATDRTPRGEIGTHA